MQIQLRQNECIIFSYTNYNNLCKTQTDAIYLYIKPLPLEFIQSTYIGVYAIEKSHYPAVGI